jgi:hypothetical protein
MYILNDLIIFCSHLIPNVSCLRHCHGLQCDTLTLVFLKKVYHLNLTKLYIMKDFANLCNLTYIDEPRKKFDRPESKNDLQLG